MNAMIPMYVYTSNFIADRVEALRDRYTDKDRGASLVEYAGLIVLAAVILAAIYGAFQVTGVKKTLTGIVQGIFQKGNVG